MAIIRAVQKEIVAMRNVLVARIQIPANVYHVAISASDTEKIKNVSRNVRLVHMRWRADDVSLEKPA